MGAKLAAPDKFCVNFMGDAAFGMTGLDFETAVRCNIPILTVVLNNSIMAIEERALPISHRLYGVRDIGGNYADMGRDMGAIQNELWTHQKSHPPSSALGQQPRTGKRRCLNLSPALKTPYPIALPFSQAHLPRVLRDPDLNGRPLGCVRHREYVVGQGLQILQRLL